MRELTVIFCTMSRNAPCGTSAKIQHARSDMQCALLSLIVDIALNYQIVASITPLSAIKTESALMELARIRTTRRSVRRVKCATIWDVLSATRHLLPQNQQLRQRSAREILDAGLRPAVCRTQWTSAPLGILVFYQDVFFVTQ